MSSRTVNRAGRMTREAFELDPVSLARALLGAMLVRVLESGRRLSGVIVETEAYLGAPDKAAHSYGGRRTPRNESMYGPPGTAYVYFTYGMHHCVNVVCGQAGEPVAVLIRALEPVEGVEAMTRHRLSPRRRTALTPTDLCSGPAKICQAMRIDRSLDGLDLTHDARLFIEPSTAGHVEPGEITQSPRIGVAYAEEWSSRPLRFHLANSHHVSRK